MDEPCKEQSQDNPSRHCVFAPKQGLFSVSEVRKNHTAHINTPEICSQHDLASKLDPSVLLESSGGVRQKQKPYLDGNAGTCTGALAQFNLTGVNTVFCNKAGGNGG